MNHLLYKINKLFKTGFFHIVLSDIICKILLYCNSIFIVRLLTKEEYGLYSYALNIVNFVMLFSGLGTSSGILQFGSASDKVKRNEYQKYALILGGVTSIILSVLVIIWGVAGNIKISNAQLPLISLGFIPVFYYLKDYLSINYRVNIQNRQYSVFNLKNAAIFLLFSIIGAAFGHLYGLIGAQYISYILIIVSELCSNKNLMIIIKTKIHDIKKRQFLNYSINAAINDALAQLLYIIDVFIIGTLIADANIVAEYKSATLIPFGLYFIPKAVVTYIYPYFVRNSENKYWIRKKYFIITFSLMIFNAIITLFLITFAPLIIKCFFGKQYTNSIITFRILSLAYFFAGTFRIPAGNILAMLRKLKFNFWNSVASGCVNIITDIILIKSFGMNGAAIATLLVIIFSSTLSQIYLVSLINRKN